MLSAISSFLPSFTNGTSSNGRAAPGAGHSPDSNQQQKPAELAHDDRADTSSMITATTENTDHENDGDRSTRKANARAEQTRQSEVKDVENGKRKKEKPLNEVRFAHLISLENPRFNLIFLSVIADIYCRTTTTCKDEPSVKPSVATCATTKCSPATTKWYRNPQQTLSRRISCCRSGPGVPCCYLGQPCFFFARPARNQY
jgi:hypothetical protein